MYKLIKLSIDRLTGEKQQILICRNTKPDVKYKTQRRVELNKGEGVASGGKGSGFWREEEWLLEGRLSSAVTQGGRHLSFRWSNHHLR